MARRIHILLSFCVVRAARVSDFPPTVEDENDENCGARYLRLQKISGKELAKGGDPDFPTDIGSIAPPTGTDCGKTAEQVEDLCGKYNEWQDVKTMSTDSDFKVIGPSGIQFNDIAQGELGTCYLLAAIASIAYKNPKVIEDMFLDKKRWTSDGIYTTRWFINGKETIIKVDGMIPMNKETKKPFFVQPSPTGEVWPIILSKAWAKIFGAYKNVNGGVPAEVYSAITSAPVDQLGVDDTDKLWAALSEAFENNFAVTSLSANDNFGLADKHAYMVMGVTMKESGGEKIKAVKMYNPWHKDKYNGVFSKSNEDKNDGTFTMSFKEFVEVFEETNIARLRPGYSPKVVTIPVGYDYSALSLAAPSDAPFVVSMNWPGRRVLTPCFRINTPDFIVAIKKNGDSDDETTIVDRETYREMSYWHTAFSKDLHGKGEYIMVARNIFGDRGEPWHKTEFVKESSVSVYAAAGFSLSKATGSDFQEALKMLGGGYPKGDKLCLDSYKFFCDKEKYVDCSMLQTPFNCPVTCGKCGPKTTTTEWVHKDPEPGSEEDLATKHDCDLAYEETCDYVVDGKKATCKNTSDGVECKCKCCGEGSSTVETKSDLEIKYLDPNFKVKVIKGSLKLCSCCVGK